MASKIYAVRKGHRTGIFYSWPECQDATKGFSGAEFKSFKSEDDAKAYLEGIYIVDTTSTRESLPSPTESMVCIYTDGSFKDNTPSFGVYVQTHKKSFGFCSIVDAPEYASSYQICSELMAVMAGVEVAIEMGYKEVFILYDYTGVESWYDGSWSAKSDIAQVYRSCMHNLVATHGLTLYFHHVKAHTGVEGNTKADSLARRARNLGVHLDTDAILSGTLSVRDVQII